MPGSSPGMTTGVNMSAPVFRFAPSPNGYLHVGHALSALINFDVACAAGGRFLLRMEDIDAARCRPRYEEAICEDLTWLGVRWEEPVPRHSAHFEDCPEGLARQGPPPGYHLSVVIDDARQGVRHIGRGEDLFWATSVHRLLQALLGLPSPTYHHHRLVLDDTGLKLSKSTRATSLRALRAG